MEFDIEDIARGARRAASVLAQASTDDKNRALLEMARLLDENRDEVLSRNSDDLKRAESSGLDIKLADRLVFGEERLAARIRALQVIAELDDPVGEVESMDRMPSGLYVGRIRVPIGVIAMVYESRPHVTVNAGALCLKSGNAAILRGGSEVTITNRYLGELWGEALSRAGLPVESVQVVPTTDRAAVRALLSLDEYIDLVIPRGGEGLIRTVLDLSRIPVIKHLSGVCHVFIDGSAQVNTAVDICVDSKTFAPEVCNAAETFLVAERAAGDFLPVLKHAMDKYGVEIRGCDKTRKIIKNATKAVESDWSTEYLDMIVAVKVVSGVDEAIEHINRYGSGHTESIVSNDFTSITAFIGGVDSGVVLVNASTMFCDGSELGMGAEIGISTDKIHARGPMGLKDLTTYKNLVVGYGHTMGGPSDG